MERKGGEVCTAYMGHGDRSSDRPLAIPIYMSHQTLNAQVGSQSTSDREEFEVSVDRKKNQTKQISQFEDSKKNSRLGSDAFSKKMKNNPGTNYTD